MYIFAYLAANPLSPPRRRICRVSNCSASPTNTLSNQLKQNKQKIYIWNKIVHSWTYVRLVNWFDCISNPLRLNPGGNYRFCWKHLTPLKIEAFSRGLNDGWGWKVTISIPDSLLTFTFTFYFFTFFFCFYFRIPHQHWKMLFGLSAEKEWWQGMKSYTFCDRRAAFFSTQIDCKAFIQNKQGKWCRKFLKCWKF